MPTSQTVYSPAKINISLHVLNKRPDNYHNIHSLMAPLNLYDRLIITPQQDKKPDIKLLLDKSNSTVLTHNFPTDNSNLISKAYFAFYKDQQLEPFALQVTIEKHIPLQAGLGGGSSNAATILNYLNALHQNHYTHAELIRIATKLGADVPFFISATPVLAKGIGEKMTPLSLTGTDECSIWLLKPNAATQPTPTLFGALMRSAEYSKEIPSVADKLDMDALFAQCHNDFEPLIRAQQPEINALFEQVASLGLKANLSGTGPTLFLIENNKEPRVQAMLETLKSISNLWISQTEILAP